MSRKKKELYEIEGPPWNEDTPWRQEADYHHQNCTETAENCRDFVILRYLNSGNTNPLADYLRTGRAPGPAVLRHLSAMLQPADGTEDKVPIKLMPKKRNGKAGPLTDAEKPWRDHLLNKNVELELAKGEKYDFGAIKNVASMLPNPRHCCAPCHGRQTQSMQDLLRSEL